MDERSVRLLAGNCGVEASGFDVRSVDDTSFAYLRRLVDDHCVVVLKGQRLDVGDELAFAARWGSPISAVHRTAVVTLDSPALKKDRAFGGWHSDMSWAPSTPYVSLLYALTIPSVGGDTLFANQRAAFEALPAQLRDRVESCDAIHRHPNPPGAFASGTATHPVVRVVTQTGRRTLFVNPVFVERLVGLDEAQSRRVLGRVYLHATRPEFSYRHRWTAGDLVVWDNRTTMHYAVADYRERRVMHRITVHEPPTG